MGRGEAEATFAAGLRDSAEELRGALLKDGKTTLALFLDVFEEQGIALALHYARPRCCTAAVFELGRLCGMAEAMDLTLREMLDEYEVTLG